MKWDFKFDPNNEGLSNSWFTGEKKFEDKIIVPFHGVQNFLDYQIMLILVGIVEILKFHLNGKGKKFL